MGKCFLKHSQGKTMLILSKEQIYQVVKTNRYSISQLNLDLCRCIDGRYQNDLTLPPLTIPGADIGQLAIIFAAANKFGFFVDRERVVEAMVEFLKTPANFHFHTDEHADPKILAGGCGYFKVLKKDPTKFFLNPKEIKFIEEKLGQLKKRGARSVTLKGDHNEGAVVIIKGEGGILPRFKIDLLVGKKKKTVGGSVFVFQQTLFNRRQKKLAKKLLAKKAVKLFSGFDEKDLALAMIKTGKNHLLETVSQLAKDLPIYQVIFDQDLGFRITKSPDQGEKNS